MFVLELFSGSAHFSHSLANIGIECHAYDIENGPQCNLLRPSILKGIEALLKAKIVICVLLGMPCQTWSRARRNDGRGPGPLRNDEEGLFGLASLNERDQAKVREGNALFNVTIALIRLCNKYGVP